MKSFCLALILLAVASTTTQARDDGRFAQSPLKGWFDGLKNNHGQPCCSDADGFAVADPDWDSRDGHYRVRLKGAWVDVPPEAVITVPNLFGRTMVWPVYYDGTPWIRCFMPGSLM